MKLSESIKPISYLKTNAAEIMREFSLPGSHTLVITQNGEAKAALIDIQTYDKLQESINMLKLLAQSNDSIQKGKVKPAKKVFQDIKQRIQDQKS